MLKKVGSGHSNTENLKIIFLRHHSFFHGVNKHLLCALHSAVYSPVKILTQQGRRGGLTMPYCLHASSKGWGGALMMWRSGATESGSRRTGAFEWELRTVQTEGRGTWRDAPTCPPPAREQRLSFSCLPLGIMGFAKYN